MNPLPVTPSDISTWMGKHFHDQILLHFLITDEVILTSPCCVTLGKLPSLSEPLFSHLQSEDNSRSVCRIKGCRTLSAGHPGPWGCFLTILDSMRFLLGFKLVHYFPGKILVQLGNTWVIHIINPNSGHLLNTQDGPGPGLTTSHVLLSPSQ